MSERRAVSIADRVFLIGVIVVATLALVVIAYEAYLSIMQKLQGITSVSVDINDITLPRPVGGTAHVTDANATQAWLIVHGFSEQLRFWIIVQNLCASIAIASVILAFVYLCVRIMRGKPFVRSVITALVVVAVMLIIFGSASEILTSQNNNALIQEALGSHPGGPYPKFQSSFLFTGQWIAVGLALGVVAIAFRIGGRLSRDTEGLV